MAEWAPCRQPGWLPSSTYLISGDDHPSADARMAFLIAGVMQDVPPQPLEQPAEILFQAVESAALAPDLSFAALVQQQPNLTFAAPYPPKAVAKIEELDGLEMIFRAPLPSLLSALRAEVAGVVGTPPPAVLAAARCADEINVADGDTKPVPTDFWVQCAIGRWSLYNDVLARRSDDEVAATLHPAPATRFANWANWLDAICLPDLLAAALAALLAYVQYGTDADGHAMHDSGLLNAVGRWLDGRAPVLGR